MKQLAVKLWVLLILICVSALHAQENYVLVINDDSLHVVDQKELEYQLEDYLLNYANQGYPHVNAQFNAYEKIDNVEYFRYRLSKGELVKIDTVVFGDYSSREIALLSRYINFSNDSLFNYSHVQSLIVDLKTNPLIDVRDKADIYRNGLRLYTKAKQNIRFDAMAAYKEEAENKGIVGNIDLELVNLGGLGRTASFHWSRPTLGVNSVDLSYTEPYIFNQAFSASLAFAQRYEDSSYVKRDLDLAIIYHLDKRSTLSINYLNEYIGSSNDGSDSLFVTQNRSASKAGFEWHSSPGNIWANIKASSSLHFATGNRLSKNEIHADMHFRSQYVGFNFKISGAFASSENPIASYDKYKLGGARFLRGAYFEQYITPAYVGWSLEGGYFQDMSIFLFYDGAFVESVNKVLHHWGLGLSLPAGNNTLTLALGVDSQESFQQAKFHVVFE